LLQIDRIEQSNLIETNDVPKIPTDQYVDVCHGSQRNMQHVGAKASTQNASCCVGIEQLDSQVTRLAPVGEQELENVI